MLSESRMLDIFDRHTSTLHSLAAELGEAKGLRFLCIEVQRRCEAGALSLEESEELQDALRTYASLAVGYELEKPSAWLTHVARIAGVYPDVRVRHAFLLAILYDIAPRDLVKFLQDKLGMYCLVRKEAGHDE